MSGAREGEGPPRGESAARAEGAGGATPDPGRQPAGEAGGEPPNTAYSEAGPPAPSDSGSDTPCLGCGGEPSPERRRFLFAVVAGSGALASTALLAPWLGMFLTPLRRPDPESWAEVGEVADFPPGETVKVVYADPAPLPWAGYAGRSAAWVRREEGDRFVAFTTYCTHVGCSVRWEEGARLFLCPCHGGAFHADGRVAAGPPPRPLDRHPIRVRNGRVELQAMAVPEPPD